MKRAHLVLSLLVTGPLWATPGCLTNRCAEFEVDALAVSAELGIDRIGGGNASLERQPARPLSEEAAIYSKRLKTLCELLWEERISYSAYRSAAREAYAGYQTSRAASDAAGGVAGKIDGRAHGAHGAHVWPAQSQSLDSSLHE